MWQRYQQALGIIQTGLEFAQTEQVNEARVRLSLLAEAVKADRLAIADPGFREMAILIYEADRLAESGRIEEASATVQRAFDLAG